ncbi:hypothetical protein L7F22_064342, partial [Adiantum nelumboides]|nr:hypothetical protein [Adiantum nelumboides]
MSTWLFFFADEIKVTWDSVWNDINDEFEAELRQKSSVHLGMTSFVQQLLNIVDPNLGTSWLAQIMMLKWGHDSWVTLEKLNLIALHDALVQNKIQWILLLESDKITRAAFGLKKRDHPFRQWLGYLAHIFERATQLVADYLDVQRGAPLSHDCTFMSYFEEIKFEARPYLFPMEVSLEAKTKEVEKQALKKVDTFWMAAQRLSF